MKIAVIDNYDSFVYNLVQYIRDLGETDITVFRNDSFNLEDLASFDKILISPGPGLPKDAGRTMEVLEKYAKTKSILGVCLGMQAMAEFYGGELYNLSKVYHGIQSSSKIKQVGILEGLGDEILIGRYHSWAVKEPLPDVLEATGWSEDGCLMAMKHKTDDLQAVQFHPESVLTPNGKMIIKNWLNQN